jgi:hypothetical protein
MNICDTKFDIDCSDCFEVIRADDNLNFIYGLTPSTQYYLWIIDKFRANYRVLITSGVDGSFDITLSDYPSGMFNKYAGDFEVFLSTDVEGLNVVDLTINAVSYSCVVLAISASTAISCQPNIVDTCSPSFITDSDGVTIFEVGSGEAGTCSPCLDVKSGIQYARPFNSNVHIVYRVGDHAWQIVNNPWNPAPTNPLYCQELVDYWTLKHDNEFGNKFRWTDQSGNEGMTDNGGGAIIVLTLDTLIDNYTGAEWGVNNGILTNNKSWNSAIDECNALNAHGFDDWYLPSDNEYDTIIVRYRVGSTLGIPFLGGGRNIWTSTTNFVTTSNALYITTSNETRTLAKSISSRNYFPIRKKF